MLGISRGRVEGKSTGQIKRQVCNVESSRTKVQITQVGGGWKAVGERALMLGQDQFISIKLSAMYRSMAIFL